MFSLLEIFSILFIHWIADFCLQTDRIARTKSTSFISLLTHVSIYCLVWLSVGFIYIMGTIFDPVPIDTNVVMNACIITFLTHITIDYYTSKLTTHQFKHGHFNGWIGGFTIVGFDQILHYIQLFVTYHYFFK